MAPKLPSDGQILGIDYGDKRVGLALATAVAKLPRPYRTVATENTMAELESVIKEEDVSLIVVGLPKSLEGNETEQSKKIRRFADMLKQSVDIDVIFADETLSSVRAEQYIKDSKTSGDVDSLAACFILEEYLGVRS